ncbi:unnamed protein product [Clonostachys rosea]|uniref:Major facilitator superfamily (MFS) profile domain-containing protein n=1 Tax=Bionectria ochroleuca TaxID=29856 RepID=A0ABY6TU10_BIOOC|nr:unnamed protein product [Clonostachys rosea]
MGDQTITPRPASVTASPWVIALASYCNMFCVGAVYGLSTIQLELPRLLSLDARFSFAPFAAACIGLSLGVGTCAPILCRIGARGTVASGTLLWGIGLVGAGHFLAASCFNELLVSLLVGGIGVGWAYLSVIIMIGQAFPNQPLARSSIGPLGFSSGVGACLVLRSYLEFGVLAQTLLGRYLQLGGFISLLVAISTITLLPDDLPLLKTSSRERNRASYGSWAIFSTLLFFNALPGMTLFAGLLPMALSLDGQGTAAALPYSMIALALGGFLAQSVTGLLGSKRSFVILFGLRGLLLLKFAQSSSSAIATLAHSAILFGHGTGFSVLPGLAKRLSPDTTSFTRSYGQILVVWGFAGVAGSLLCSLYDPLSEGPAVLGQLFGFMAIFSSALLYVSPLEDYLD